jgi:putative endonuclease
VRWRRWGSWADRHRAGPGSDGHELGRAGEGVAERYLRGCGYTIVARNYRCRGGEIDLIALDRADPPGDGGDATVVFVEVKTRRTGDCGGPFEAVDARKCRRISQAAHHFLLSRGGEERAVRFDVVGVQWDEDTPRVEHVRNAFEVE